MQFGKNPFNGFLAACKILRPAMRTIFLEASVCCAVMAGSATWRRWLPLTHIGVINGLHGVGWRVVVVEGVRDHVGGAVCKVLPC